MATEESNFMNFEMVGAIIRNSHIVYTSGKHGEEYVNKDAIYPHTSLTSDLCKQMAVAFQRDAVEVVAAPEKGGIILSQWTAYWLTKSIMSLDREVLSAYAEKDGDTFTFRRGYDKIIPDKRVLVVEDLLNTGGSAQKTVELVRKYGGTVVGVAALCNRGGVTKEMLDVPRLYSLVNISMKMYEPTDCPLCRMGRPINTTVGHGKQFLAQAAQ
jgi:orotate phosphoribosyltransferase